MFEGPKFIPIAEVLQKLIVLQESRLWMPMTATSNRHPYIALAIITLPSSQLDHGDQALSDAIRDVINEIGGYQLENIHLSKSDQNYTVVFRRSDSSDMKGLPIPEQFLSTADIRGENRAQFPVIQPEDYETVIPDPYATETFQLDPLPPVRDFTPGPRAKREFTLNDLQLDKFRSFDELTLMNQTALVDGCMLAALGTLPHSLTPSRQLFEFLTANITEIKSRLKLKNHIRLEPLIYDTVIIFAIVIDPQHSLYHYKNFDYSNTEPAPKIAARTPVSSEVQQLLNQTRILPKPKLEANTSVDYSGKYTFVIAEVVSPFSDVQSAWKNFVTNLVLELQEYGLELQAEELTLLYPERSGTAVQKIVIKASFDFARQVLSKR